MLALDYNCHLFIEKPITETVMQAETLLTKAKKKNIHPTKGTKKQIKKAHLQ